MTRRLGNSISTITSFHKGEEALLAFKINFNYSLWYKMTKQEAYILTKQDKVKSSYVYSFRRML